MVKLQFLVVLVVLLTLQLAQAKKAKEQDPKHCEVCIANLEAIDALLEKKDKKNKEKIETAISKHCTKSGAGSTWKANPALTNPRDVKMCYYFEPIKRAISQPFSTGMPKTKVCQRLTASNPEICEVKYPIKVEKKEGEEVDYGKLRVKQLKTILDQRGVRCTGCTEKSDFVKKCQETEHLDL